MNHDAAPNAPLALTTVLIDNDRVRVTRFVFPPGHTTGFHTHEFDYTVVPLITGELHITETDNPGPVTLTAGEPYFRQAGVSHCLTNMSDQDVAFVEVELLTS
jgi:quercetin dioxygenase-like cupin family protein